MAKTATSVITKKPSQIANADLTKKGAGSRHESASEIARRILGDQRQGVQVLAQNVFVHRALSK
ncbi:hypothetical protein [Mesorhizobium sp. B263B2A]|uniref:hypothetical protein n=1 Tax=Mesorhizobium sp. B263B2A TaxID=2876669 RepID=UPI001CD184D3|nr:hypothetical protein [Mesorhizobium sp. B263B2A]MCA0031647.1 hypothetical protein [Mesorhizobium sp. B263B2A]